MSIGLCFWVLFLIYVIFGGWANRASLQGGDFGPFGGSLLLSVLLFLLGWGVFGFIVHG